MYTQTLLHTHKVSGTMIGSFDVKYCTVFLFRNECFRRWPVPNPSKQKQKYSDRDMGMCEILSGLRFFSECIIIYHYQIKR